jgi:hypothetical protein
MTTKVDARPPDSERCNSMADKGGRCPEVGAWELLNGGQHQGLACEEHMRRMVHDFPFLTGSPIPHLMKREVEK